MGRPKIAILSVGVPGSGAQAVARTLGELGARLPPSAEISAALDAFLAASGSGWDDPLPLPQAVFAGRLATTCHDAVVDILARDLAEAEILAIADPRLCRLLPLWRRITESMGVLPQVVLPLRPPAATAAALRGVIPRPQEAAPALWLDHMLAAERDSRGLRRWWVRYDAFVADPRTATAALAERLACFVPSPAGPAATAVEQVWADERATYAGSDRTDDLPAWVRGAYDWFLDATTGAEPTPESLDALAAGMDQAARLFGPWLDVPALTRQRLAQVESQLSASRSEADRLRETAKEGEESCRTLDVELRQTSERAARLEGECDTLRAEIERVRQERDDLARARTDLRCEIDGLAARLNDGDGDLARRVQQTEDALATLARIATGLHGILPLRQRLGGLVRAALRGRLRQRLAEDRDIATIARSGRFDTAFYIGRYPDIAANKIDPIIHYVRCGSREGRNPHPDFDTRFYCGAYPDVVRAGVNPLAHYIRFGAAEGRQPGPNGGAPRMPAGGLDLLLAARLFGRTRRISSPATPALRR